MHGSVYFKALDDAAYFAVSSLVTDYLLVTVSFNLHLYVRFQRIIKAEGRLLSTEKRPLLLNRFCSIAETELCQRKWYFC